MLSDFDEKKILESINISLQNLLEFIAESEKIKEKKNKVVKEGINEDSAFYAVLISMINEGEEIYKNLYAILFYENAPNSLPNVCAINKLERFIGEIPIILQAVELKNHYLKNSSTMGSMNFIEKGLQFIPIFKHFAISVKNILIKKESGDL